MSTHECSYQHYLKKEHNTSKLHSVCVCDESPSSHGAWDGTQAFQQASYLLNSLVATHTSLINNVLELEKPKYVHPAISG